MSTASDHRAWAKDHFVGVENTTFPSFTTDLTELDEEGVRHDVRQAKAHGFFSTLVATESGVTFEEAKRLVSIVADEAGSDLLVSTTLLFDSFAQDMEMLRHAEQAGAHAVLLGFPANWRPSSVEEIYRAARTMIDSTSLGVVLYPSDHFNFGRLAESEFPLEVMHRLVEDCPNVIAIKIGNPGHILACHTRYGDQVLLGNPMERQLPASVLGFGMQWMGAGCYEVFQSPDKPYLVDYFRLLREGKTDEAMEIYWRLTPARMTFEQQFGQTVRGGTYHWTQQKFYQWCTGGNGGITRQPSLKLHDPDIAMTMNAFRAIGIQPPDDVEQFFTGRAAWARGDRVTAPGA